MQKSKFNPKSRIIAIYKPKGPTSHDIINQLRRLTGIKRIGHAGTLDPLASGVLVVGISRQATKTLGEIVSKEKEYLATIRLGATSATDDAEGPITIYPTPLKPAKKMLNRALKQFVGQIRQIPPSFSAVKIKGKEAYKLARRGTKVTLPAKNVEIKQVSLLEYKYPTLKIRVVTGPGVYIRSLARDLGQSLKTGAYLADLERTRVGQFTKAKSLKLSELGFSSLFGLKPEIGAAKFGGLFLIPAGKIGWHE